LTQDQRADLIEDKRNLWTLRGDTCKVQVCEVEFA
jgi:hypothetical protein